MIPDEELTTLWRGGETDRVEFKQSDSHKNRHELHEQVCAFANDLPGHGKPGYLFIGVKKDGICTGLTVDDDLLQKLAQIRLDGSILPPPVLSVQRRELDETPVAVIEVHPSSSPPVSHQGRIWVRTGSTKHVASAAEERLLSERRRAMDRPFDSRPLAGSTVNDLDLTLFERVYLHTAVAPDVLEANGRTLEERLASLKLMDAGGTPTVAGILVLGKDPRVFLPGAYIQFTRFEGTELDGPVLSQHELDGPIPDLLARLNEVLKLGISTRSDISVVPEVRRPDYPLVALQQLAYNAVLHRTYEGTNAPAKIFWFADRIEIISPGGLYGAVTPTNFGRSATEYRNPVLAEVIKNLGYVQRFGAGIPMARRAMATNGNPEPDFQFPTGHILVTLRPVP